MISAAVIAAGMLASCSNKEIVDEQPETDGVSASVLNIVPTVGTDTRAGFVPKTEWAVNDAMGLFMYKATGWGDVYPRYDAQNNKSTKTAAGWSQAKPVYLLSDKATIWAYYPYNQAVADGTKVPVPINAGTSVDYMWGKNTFQGLGTEYKTLLGAFDKDNESFKKRIGIDWALSSYKVRVRSRNHLATFIKKYHRRNDISMLELTPDFIKEYEIYLSTDAGLHNASVWSNCMWLKTIVAKVHYNGLIQKTPFAQYRVSQNVKEREYLTEDEIKTVMTHEFANRKLAYIRDLFVFASFTALSFWI